MPKLVTHLSYLEQSGLISIAKLLPELEYLFRHALVHDAAYESLLRQDRRRLHHAVGEVLEVAYADQPQHAATLAHHFHAANEPDRARHYYWIAGTTAQANYANAEAAQHFAAALELSTTDDQRLQAMHQSGSVLQLIGHIPEALAILHEAIQLADQLADLDEIANLYTMMSQAYWYNGDHPRALATGKDGLAKIEASPPTRGMVPTRGLVLLLRQTARMCHFVGVPQEGIPYAERARLLATELDLNEDQAEILITLGILHIHTDPAFSLQCYQQAAEIAEEQRQFGNAARAHVNWGSRLGDLDDAEGLKQHNLRAIEFARQAGDGTMQLLAINNVIDTLIWMGDLDQADALLATERDIFRQGLQPQWAVENHDGYAALARCQRGDWEGGLPDLRQWAAQKKQAGDYQRFCGAAVSLADFLVQRGFYEEAEHYLMEAMPYADQGLGVSPVYARNILIGLFAAQGRITEAHQCLEDARGIARKLNYPLDSGDLLMAQARVMAAEGRWEEVASLYADVDRWYGERKLRPSQGQVRLLWADALYRMGQRDQALAFLNDTLDLYAGMGAHGYVDLVRQRIDVLSQAVRGERRD
jgi:tetratricopeptide (TPR) repeat protein